MDLLALSLLVRWLLGWALCLRMPRLPASRVQGQPMLSVLIPARNEEHTLPNLLAALRLQSLTPQEVIVIDDHSDDRTGAIAAANACGQTWASVSGRPAASQSRSTSLVPSNTTPLATGL